MDRMNITSAQYINDEMIGKTDCIVAVIDGQEMFVPLDEANRHYSEILRQVEAGELTIQPAE